MTDQVRWQPIQPIHVEPPYSKREVNQYRPATVHADVLVPIALAIISGVITAIALGWLCWEIDWFPDWLPPFGLLIATAAVWVWRIKKHDDQLTTAYEVAQIDTPAVPVTTERDVINISLAHDNADGKRVLRLFELPCTRDVLMEVADAMLAGSTLPESDWAGLKNGKPFSEAGLKKFKIALITADLARYINPTNPRLGVVLTDKGKEFMQETQKAILDAKEDGE